MKITLMKPKAINQIGGRSNNEDSIYPLMGKATNNDKLFLVCDGVGGNEKGEVASRLACDKFVEYYYQKKVELSSEANIAEALKYTENAFDQFIAENPESKGMGTTLTLLYFHENGATIAHIGDSRVYQYRSGQIVFQTSDHSLVNDLLKAGVINEEQAKEHPRKNVISRAIQGATVKATNADVKLITDVQPGDYFFLCTDGILENISDFEIAQILIQGNTNNDKIELISRRCEESPNDNFSAYLVQIDKVEGQSLPPISESVVEAEVDLPEAEIIPTAEVQKALPDLKSFFGKVKKILPIMFVGVVLLVWFFWPSKETKKTEKAENTTESSSRMQDYKDTKEEKVGSENSQPKKQVNPTTDALVSELQQEGSTEKKIINTNTKKPDSVKEKVDSPESKKTDPVILNQVDKSSAASPDDNKGKIPDKKMSEQIKEKIPNTKADLPFGKSESVELEKADKGFKNKKA